MRSKFYYFFLTAMVILVAASLTTRRADATLAPDYTFTSAVVKADLIVKGKVIETRSEWVDGPHGKNIFTYVRIRVDIAIKGEPNGEDIEFRVMGGTVGDITQTVSDSATFNPTEEAIVLLEQSDTGIFHMLSGYGKISIKEGKISWANSVLSVGQFVRALNAFIEDPDSDFNQHLGLNQDTPLLEEREEMDVGLSVPSLEAREISGLSHEETIGREHLSIEQPGTPDLRPYKRSSWDDTIVISNVKGTGTTASTIYDDETIYVDFGCGNYGSGDAGHFRYGLYIDGTLVGYVDASSMPASTAGYVQDAAEGPLSAGTHTFKVVCDYNNEVSESNENNNEYSRTYTIFERFNGSTISSISPDRGSAGTGTEVTIDGNGFGSTRGNGKVEFWYGRGNTGDPDRIEAPIVSWSDTRIVCEVPVARLNNYSASACSGPLRVTTHEGGLSNEVTFIVTFSYMGNMWENLSGNPEVPYRINENTSDCTGEGAAVRAGAETWNNGGAAFSFEYAGTHSNTDVGFNNNNDIMWSDSLPTGVVARATRWYTTDGIMKEADIAYNDKDYLWSCDNNVGPDEFDIQSIIVHELGHWLSLRDLYGDIGDGINDTAKVMYGRGSTGEAKRSLHRDDISGIRWIYGDQEIIKADFTADVTSGTAPLAVGFTDQSTGDITSWSWDFGDGSTSTKQNPSNTYTDPGTYTVNLTVTGPEGSDTETKTDFISVSQPPMSCQPSQGTIGTQFTIFAPGCGAKKGKVAIGSMKCKVLEWTDTSVRALLKKVQMGPGKYDVMIMPKGKGVAPIVMNKAFSIMAPDILAVETNGNSAAITGLFFGTQKVKAYLVVDGTGRRKKLKVTSLEMNPTTGFSRLEVTVSNKVLKNLESRTYPVIVTNSVGSDNFSNGLTIE